MPYLESNQDVHQQEGFKTALMGAAVIFGGAAIGAGYLSKMGKGLGPKPSGKKVAKQLYGSGHGLSDNALSNIKIRNANDIAEDGMTKYALGKSWTGKQRIYSKNESILGRFKDNHLNKDVRAFNKTIGDYKKGNFDNDIYGKSQMTLYQDLYDKTQAGGIGLDTKDLTKLTKDIHASQPNVDARKAAGWSKADDIRLSDSIWGGGDYGGTTASQRVDDYFTKDIDDAILDRNAELGKKAMAEREAAAMAEMQSKQRSNILAEQRTTSAQNWKNAGSTPVETPFTRNAMNAQTQQSANPSVFNTPNNSASSSRNVLAMSSQQQATQTGTINAMKDYMDNYSQVAMMSGTENPLNHIPSVGGQRPKARTKRGTGSAVGGRNRSANRVIAENTVGGNEPVQQTINRTTGVNKPSYLERTSDNPNWPMSQSSYEQWYSHLLNQ